MEPIVVILFICSANLSWSIFNSLDDYVGRRREHRDVMEQLKNLRYELHQLKNSIRAE